MWMSNLFYNVLIFQKHWSEKDNNVDFYQWLNLLISLRENLLSSVDMIVKGMVNYNTNISRWILSMYCDRFVSQMIFWRCLKLKAIGSRKSKKSSVDNVMSLIKKDKYHLKTIGVWDNWNALLTFSQWNLCINCLPNTMWLKKL